MIVVSYGGGTNSTALLVGLRERGIRPDMILYGDTGSEHPRTTEYLKTIAPWLKDAGFPPVHVRRWGLYESLEAMCLQRRELPSLAYGNKGCSVKFKRQPVDGFVRDIVHAMGIDPAPVRRAIGFGEDERHRNASPKPGVVQYPLREWGWGRDECMDAIERAGLPQPGKSACFFCPNADAREVLALAKEHPDLVRRAVAIEQNAETRTVIGLGRTWRWGDLFTDLESLTPKQMSLPMCGVEMACDCFDGEAA